MEDHRPTAPPNIPKSLRFNLRTLMFAIAGIALALHGIRLGWERAWANVVQQQVRNDFKHILLGLNQYAVVHEHFPAAVRTDHEGRSLSSWRFALPLYMESLKVRMDSKVAWDAPANARLRAIPFSYFCWDDSSVVGNTNVFAITGGDTAFAPSAEPNHSLFLSQYSVDDLPPTLAIATEVADSKTHWMQPGDYNVAELLAATGRLGNTVKGVLPDRIHLLFADGEVWALSPDMPIDALKPFLTVTGAKTASREALLSDYQVD